MGKTLNIQTGEIQEVELDRPILMTEEEGAAQKLTELRRMRNFKLSETDYMGNSDVTMSAKWKTYRQALRDITKDYTSLDDVVWPEKP